MCLYMLGQGLEKKSVSPGRATHSHQSPEPVCSGHCVLDHEFTKQNGEHSFGGAMCTSWRARKHLRRRPQPWWNTSKTGRGSVVLCAHFTGRLRSGTWPLLVVHPHSNMCIPTRATTCVSGPSVVCKVFCHAYTLPYLQGKRYLHQPLDNQRQSVHVAYGKE